ncbi:LptA/OstA family protein [Thermotoga profunda]|uniref:LptA/OstA family protein n=1 Tax=Thermotoga profunda TaxID=1508420 RepID=UPI00059704C2|nr:LptA/OstA family protein [Thermotoga profunda]
MKKIIVLFICFLAVFYFAKTVHIVADYVKPEKEQAFYEGNVKVEIEEDKIKVYCESMKVSKYQNEWRLVDAKKSEVFFEDGVATSTALKYDIKLKTGTMTDNVKAEVIDKESTDTILINCDSMDIDLDKDIFKGSSQDVVKIYKGKIEATAKRFSYDRKSGKIELEGNVILLDHDKNIKMWADRVQITTVDDKMVATNAKVELIVEE